MVVMLLIVIYLGFVSLGLPDALFGATWPVLQPQLDVPLAYAGFVTMTVSGGTIISSMLSDRMTSKLGPGVVTFISVAMTAGALVGFSFSTEFWMLILFAIPLGLGAGAVDAALNNFVALHFASKHMSWLHCFWGVGASISPYIMSFWLARNNQWDKGYLTVGLILAALSAVLLVSLPLWKKMKTDSNGNEVEVTEPQPLKKVLKLPGIKSVLFAFFAYCTVEATIFSWTSSYLVIGKGLDAETAAGCASLFYLGMTLSRFLTGFIADKFGDKKMIRYGYIITFVGLLLTLLPVQSSLPCLVGLAVAGFGCGPVYPAVIHATPDNFGKENSQAVVGIQMAFAYCGSTFMPPVFGLIANNIDIRFFPVFITLFAVVGFVMTELVNKSLKPKNKF